MKGKETFDKIVEQMEIVKAEGEKFYGGNKSAGMRARSALDKVANLKVAWRKEVLAK